VRLALFCFFLYLYIRDHLGNIRAVVSGDGRVLETNNYYPYGMQIKPLSQTAKILVEKLDYLF